jgi:hypothetical protein
MKIPKFNLQRSLFFSLVLLTPLIAVTDLVRAENIDSLTSEQTTTKNSIDFSQNLGEKIHNGFLLARNSEPFVRIDFVRAMPKPKLQPETQMENISALQTFESLLG